MRSFLYPANMRSVVAVGVTCALLALPASYAFADETDVEMPTTTTVGVESTSVVAPTTTSEFGTATEIEIALDDNGEIIPGDD